MELQEQPNQETKSTDTEKVYRLTVELADVKAQKKSHSKAYNEEIKRIQSEINDLTSKDRQTFEIV